MKIVNHRRRDIFADSMTSRGQALIRTIQVNRVSVPGQNYPDGEAPKPGGSPDPICRPSAAVASSAASI
jgi:hypothetical protein